EREQLTGRQHAEWSLRMYGDRRMGKARDLRVFAGRNHRLFGWALIDVGETHPLHSVEVIQVAPEFLEAMRGRQRVSVIAQVGLAEFAGIVTEVAQKHRERRRAG